MLDLLIRNATIVDGAQTPRYPGDIAIQAGRIAGIGQFPEASARVVIDATDRVVTPGFIDMHSHADLSLLSEPEAASCVRQGITTVVTGQCGMSPGPFSDAYRAESFQTLRLLLPACVPLDWDSITTFDSFVMLLAGLHPALNVVPLVGHGMLRAAVMGCAAGDQTAGQRNRVRDYLREAMDAGAFGISSGLIYPPGSFTGTADLIDIAQAAAERGGLYFSHIRNEGGSLLEAISEAIAIGRASGAAVEISHLKASGRRNWDLAPRALELIDAARAGGLDVTADMYPYVGGATYFAALLPRWAMDGGAPGLLKRLETPEGTQEIAAAMRSGVPGATGDYEWENIIIAGSAIPAHIGRTVAALAAEAGADPVEWSLDALRATRADMQMVQISMSEDNVRLQMRHPAVMFGTDGLGVSIGGGMAASMMHPRVFGAYPRIFGAYVREEHVLSLEEASWKASGFPAAKLGLGDRGVIRQGCWADLVVFDPLAIRDEASWTQPARYPSGIDAVLVNGQIVVEGNRQTSARPGAVLRRVD